jgi:hypothetical protein
VWSPNSLAILLCPLLFVEGGGGDKRLVFITLQKSNEQGAENKVKIVISCFAICSLLSPTLLALAICFAPMRNNLSFCEGMSQRKKAFVFSLLCYLLSVIYYLILARKGSGGDKTMSDIVYHYAKAFKRPHA